MIFSWLQTVTSMSLIQQNFQFLLLGELPQMTYH